MLKCNLIILLYKIPNKYYLNYLIQYGLTKKNYHIHRINFYAKLLPSNRKYNRIRNWKLLYRNITFSHYGN